MAREVGWVRWYFADERWEWSEEVERMHGYERGTVVPTTELVLSHKHPDDAAQVKSILNDVLRTHGAFSTRHRIIDTHGRIRHVVVVGDQMRDGSGRVIGTQGFYVDLSAAREEDEQDLVTAAVAEIAESRAVIEQAKGMLMLIYRIDAAAAFDLLRWRSQETNVKLRLFATQLASDLAALHHEETLPRRSTYDQLLLTAHLRIGSRPTSTADT
jgi:PAS domain S-box-containing protein